MSRNIFEMVSRFLAHKEGRAKCNRKYIYPPMFMVSMSEDFNCLEMEDVETCALMRETLFCAEIHKINVSLCAVKVIG